MFDLDTREGMANAVAWQEKLCTMLKDGGKWGIPRSESTYTVYPSKKLAVTGDGEPEVNRVFEAMGWEVRTHGA